MNLIEINAIKRHLDSQVKQINTIQVNCRQCNNFETGICKQFGAKPPLEWITGTVECEHWEWDQIPF